MWTIDSQPNDQTFSPDAGQLLNVVTSSSRFWFIRFTTSPPGRRMSKVDSGSYPRITFGPMGMDDSRVNDEFKRMKTIVGLAFHRQRVEDARYELGRWLSG